MPLYTPQEASWISRANAVVDGRRHLSDEEMAEVITGDDPPFKLRNAADWLMKMGKTMEQKEVKKNEALTQEKVSRGELIMALMGFCSTATYNQLMVYTMAMMKVLEDKGIVTKDEIRAQIALFAKGKDDSPESATPIIPDEPDAEAAVMSAIDEQTPVEEADELLSDAPMGHNLEKPEDPGPDLN